MVVVVVVRVMLLEIENIRRNILESYKRKINNPAEADGIDVEDPHVRRKNEKIEEMSRWPNHGRAHHRPAKIPDHFCSPLEKGPFEAKLFLRRNRRRAGRIPLFRFRIFINFSVLG